MAGLSRTAADINTRAGAVALSTRQLLNDIGNFKAMIDRVGGHDGMVAEGITDADATLIFAAATDLYNLAQVAQGKQAQPSATDFLFNSANLTGTM